MLFSGFFRRLRGIVYGLALLLLTVGSTAALPDAAALYREEIGQAPARLRSLGWRGGASEDVRFAAVLSGLTWQPVWEGTSVLLRDRDTAFYVDGQSRYTAFGSAKRAANPRCAIPFALSLVLDPPTESRNAWDAAYDYLDTQGEDFERVLVGILTAPNGFPLLSTHQYAAADVLVFRAPAARLLPLLLTLSDSSDRYLRSRAVAALGVVAYRKKTPQETDPLPGLRVPLRENLLSATQQRLIQEVLHRAAEDKNYRVRAAAAFAFALAGDESDVPLLEKLAKDRTYLLTAVEAGGAAKGRERGAHRIVFPVRAQALLALARLGKPTPAPVSGKRRPNTEPLDDPSREIEGRVLQGKALREAERGGNSQTGDYGDVRKDQSSRVRFYTGAW